MKQHLIGVSSGSGFVAKKAEQGGADFILALNSGRFRQMGQGSLAGFMPYSNSNKLVMEFASKELIPRIKKIPVLFGLNASDPTILLKEFIRMIKDAGFSGINNYPTIGLIDGKFREALEEQNICYDMEVEAIKYAHDLDMFTLAFVFNETQAKKMLEAGADIICVHLGLTKGGDLGAKKVLSLEASVDLAKNVFDLCDKFNPKVIKMVYGGPVHTPIDVEYMYNNTSAEGYIGGSSFDRTPSEKVIVERTREFKSAGLYEKDILLQKMLKGIKKNDYINFVKEYVAVHYMEKISFSDLAEVAYVSRSYLSTLFSKETGCTFPNYLNDYRVHKACELIENEKLSLLQVANAVGYNDYAHFSKVFKKITGCTPIAYMRHCNKT